ncbi:hypothetical protein [Candidatus Nitrotoga arctica]|nr:hypothetical protein [Candidatus Nitrotoga arctica]
MATYVDVKKYTEAPIDVPLAERGIYQWSLKSDLADYISNILPNKVKSARKQQNYSEVAEELRSKIFPYAAADLTVGGARSAFDSLSKLTSAPKIHTMLVRAIINEKYVYAPLAMLAAGSGIEKKINGVYPLHRENYDISHCIDQWTIVYPQELYPLSDMAFDEKVH